MKSFFSVARWATLLAFAFLAAPDLAKAQITLSVQGTLKKTNDQSVDDGAYDLTFKLYNVDAGGTALWSETQTGLLISGGIYSAQLGAVNALDVPFDQPYFLGVTVNGKEMLPRTALTAAPYALALSGADNEFPGSGNVGINTLDPTTSLDANGSISTGTTTTSAAAYTVLAADHVVFLDLAGAQAVTLPSAATFPRREIVLINKTSTAKTVSSYVDFAGNAATVIPANGMIELRSNGTEWRLATTYASPATVGKAYVRCKVSGLSQTGSSYATVPYTEIDDAQNCWNTTTHTFTAPRTGNYRISSSFGISSNSSMLMDVYATTNGVNERVWFGYALTTITGASWSVDFPMTANQTLYVRLYNNASLSTFTVHGSTGFLTISEI